MGNNYNPNLSYDPSGMPVGPHGLGWSQGASHFQGNLSGGPTSIGQPGLLSNDPQEFYNAVVNGMNSPFSDMIPDWAKQVVQAGGGPQQMASNPGWSQNMNLGGDEGAAWGQQMGDYMTQQQNKQYQPGGPAAAGINPGETMLQEQADFQARMAAHPGYAAEWMNPASSSYSPGGPKAGGGTAGPYSVPGPTPTESPNQSGGSQPPQQAAPNGPTYATATPMTSSTQQAGTAAPFANTTAPTVPATPTTQPQPDKTNAFDGQTGVTNPQPYPGENSPQPYDGERMPGESVSEMAKRHLERMQTQQDFLLPAILAMMSHQSPRPQPTPKAVGDPLVLEKAGWNPDKSTKAADSIIENNYDGDCDTAYAGHVRAPMGGRGGVPKPQSNMGTAGGLNRILSGLSGANRRGQMASYRVGEPGVAYDATTPGGQPDSSSDPYNSSAQNLGAPISPWLMPWQGNFTAPMSGQEQQGLGGMSNFVGGGMNLGGAKNYNDALLGGQYIGGANPYMNQIQSGMQTLKDNQDQQAQRAIGSSMAAGGNALSGARMAANQQYQNLSDANFNQNIGNMQLQNLTNERRLQNAGVGQAEGLANTEMGGYQNLMNAGALPRQLEQQDTNSQYADWLRQIGSMNSTNQNQQQLANNLLHTTYPGSSQPNYGQSSAAGWGGLIASLLGGGGGGSGGGGLVGSNGSLLSTGGSGGLLNSLYNSLFGGGGNDPNDPNGMYSGNQSGTDAVQDPTTGEWYDPTTGQIIPNYGQDMNGSDPNSWAFNDQGMNFSNDPYGDPMSDPNFDWNRWFDENYGSGG